MKTWGNLLAALILTGAISVAGAGTIYVPDNYGTIQAAINAAADGVDEVVVRDDTYTGVGNKNLDFNGKAITVRSENGPTACIIDCQKSGRGFDFHTHETASSILDGFTIRNGSVTDGGGGIRCYVLSHPTIRNCVVTECSSVNHAGGINVYGYCNPTISNCTISGNSAGTVGGGIYCDSNVAAIITDCIISGNDSYSWGGGIACQASNITVRGCTITGNVGNRGGGIDIAECDPTIEYCTFSGNTAGGTWANGGAIHCYGQETNATIRDCTVVGNTANNRGGALCTKFKSETTITNCTFSGNSAREEQYYGGGAMYVSEGSTVTVRNCILWGDTGEGHECGVYTSALTIDYSDVEGGQADIVVEYDGTLTWGSGNIDVDPRFVSAGSDYHLTPASPCIDTGDPAFVPALGETDIDGETRVWDGDGDAAAVVDMGSDEYTGYALADLNCDGLVNFFDIDPFVAALLATAPGYDEYYAEYPDCDRALADCNDDELVNFFDIDPFVDLLLGA